MQTHSRYSFSLLNLYGFWFQLYLEFFVLFLIFFKTFWQITSPTDDCFGADFPVHLEPVQIS